MSIKNWFLDKWHRFFHCQWFRMEIKKVLIEIAVVSVIIAIWIFSSNLGGVTLDQPITTIADGQTIEFQYTDENVTEDFIIHTDKEVYNPLWAWSGFDVYVSVENKSGIDQDIYFQTYFSKDFTVEKVYLLDESATSSVLEPIYEETCKEVATSTGGMFNECRTNKVGEEQVILLGVWNETNQDIFSVLNYNDLVKDKDIKIKEKSGNKITGHFKKTHKKDKINFYKLLVKANESFSEEEFDLEVLGSEGGYGLLDPTIVTEDFNSYGDGTLNGTSSWTGDTDFKIQGTTVYEGAKAATVASGANTGEISKTATAQTDGRVTVYMRVDGTTSSGAAYFNLFTGTTPCWVVYAGYWGTDIKIYSGGWVTIGSYTSGNWFSVEIEWRSVDHLFRTRIDDGDWTDWIAGHPSGIGWSSLNKVIMGSETASMGYYWDYIAQDPYTAPAVTETKMNVIMIN